MRGCGQGACVGTVPCCLFCFSDAWFVLFRHSRVVADTSLLWSPIQHTYIKRTSRGGRNFISRRTCLLCYSCTALYIPRPGAWPRLRPAVLPQERQGVGRPPPRLLRRCAARQAQRVRALRSRGTTRSAAAFAFSTPAVKAMHKCASGGQDPLRGRQYVGPPVGGSYGAR